MEIAASKAAVSALLDYVYGGQPKVNLEAGVETTTTGGSLRFAKVSRCD